METEPLPMHLKELRTISGSLYNILVRSFGPMGAQALITSNTGGTIITKDGVTIISALLMSHPVARVIVDSVMSFCTRFADGSKTMIIYVHELVTAIEQNSSKVDFRSSHDAFFRGGVSKILHDFICDDLVTICNDMAAFLDKMKGGKCVQQVPVIENPLPCIVRSSFNVQPNSASDHLTNQVAAFITSVVESGLDIHILNKFYDSLIFMLPNQPNLNSHFERGLFLQGSFSGHRSIISSTKCVVMLGFLPGNEDTMVEDVVVLKDSSVGGLVTYQRQAFSKFIESLTRASVSLVLTTEKVPDYIVEMCCKQDISVVSCLEISDVELLRCVTKKTPVNSIHENMDSSQLISVVSCEHVIKGGKEFVKLMMEPAGNTCVPYGLFLCAPTENMCKVMKTCAIRSLKVVQHCLPRQGARFSPEIVNLSYSEVGDFSPVLSEITTSAKMGDATNYIPRENEKSGHLSQFLVGNLVPGRGHFENILICFLTRFSRKNLPCQKQFCCLVLTKMLQAVPKILLDCGLHSNSGGRHNLKEQMEIMRNIHECIESGVNSETLWRSLWGCGVEVLSVKFEVLFAAIHLVIKLLKIESIVSVKRIPKSDSSQNQESETDW